MATSLKKPESVVRKTRPRQWPQYLACLSVTLGAIAAGLSSGWSSSAGSNGSNLRYSFTIDSEEFSWVSSILPFGGALVSIPVGLLIDLTGRRRALLSLVLTFTIGWACTIWPNSIATLIIGRFILGASGGGFFIITPIYISEISDKEARGRLNFYFMLAYYVGIFMAYVMGLLNDMFLMSIISAMVPYVFFIIFFFMPETPTYYLIKGNIEAARETLLWLRGSEFDVDAELEEKKKGLAEAKCEKGSLFDALSTRGARKGLLIAYGLMFFMSFSGLDAITYYLSSIFTDATGKNGDLYSIAVGGMDVVAIFLFSFVIDKWGRKLLLLISGSAMCLSTLVLGVYFYFVENNSNVEDFEWVPFLCISSFSVFSVLGFSVIPWIMVSEIFPAQIKAIAASSASMAGIIMCSVVIKTYSSGKNNIGCHGMFWLYSTASAIGIIFVYFVVPETKNKSLEQIHKELSGENDSCENSRK